MSNLLSRKIKNFNREPDKKTFNNSKNAAIAKGLNELKSSKEREKRVYNYKRDVVLDVIFNSVKVSRLTIDFIIAYADGSLEHVYTKQLKPGPEAELFKLKKRLIEIQYGIDIIER